MSWDFQDTSSSWPISDTVTSSIVYSKYNKSHSNRMAFKGAIFLAFMLGFAFGMLFYCVLNTCSNG